MIKLYIDAIGMATPGMPSWQAARRVLSGSYRYFAEPLDRYQPMLLPPNEKRRATNLTRLAFRVCEEVFQNNLETASKALSVFASSGGDYQIVDQICRVLCEKDRTLSPTQFHNSVHNSTAGYWSIAAHSTAASTSLSCHDRTFAAGLLEAASMAIEANQFTMLVTYDTELPEPLVKKRNVCFPFASAFLLSPTQTEQSIASFFIKQSEKQNESVCSSTEMESLRIGNPAARSLPLLQLLANRQNGKIVVTLSRHNSIILELNHC